MQQISEHVYAIHRFGAMLNMYLIANGDSLTLIDTGIGDSDVKAIESALASKGWSLQNIKHILITHAHPDHIGGLAAIQKRVNAHTYVHRLDANVTRGERGQVFAPMEELNFLWRTMASLMAKVQIAPARVDTEFQDADEFPQIIEGLKVIHLPGHSYGHSAFWLEKEGVLIAGDVMMNLPWGAAFPVRAPSVDWAGVKTSIAKVADLNPSVLLLGHGKPIKGNVREVASKLLK
jgi:glyoxylase-like metal-dependent hydrolase (beta-lactamase superfamily II)